MKISLDEKKAEAVRRMKALDIAPEIIRQFEAEGRISISIGIRELPLGAFFWAKDEELQGVREFEREYNALVYHVVRSYPSIGKLDSYLYVSDHREEWDDDRARLNQGETCAYVYNHDMPDCSESGFIGIETTIAGSLCRTW